MCIRDRGKAELEMQSAEVHAKIGSDAEKIADSIAANILKGCLLYTSDAADERSSVDLGGRRIIKKNKKGEHQGRTDNRKKIIAEERWKLR